MKGKLLVYSISALLIVLLQSIVFEQIKIFNVKPNLLIVFIITVALLRNSKEGAVVGFFFGLAQDIVSGKMIGLYALLGFYLGLVVGALNKRLYRDNILVVIFFTFVSSIAYELVIFLTTIYIKSQSNFIFAIKNIILPEAVYNSIASIFIYFLVNKFSEWFEGTTKIKRRY